jgi:hypothetical protein
LLAAARVVALLRAPAVFEARVAMPPEAAEVTAEAAVPRPWFRAAVVAATTVRPVPAPVAAARVA